MAGDKFDQLYNALKADGAVSGTREHFRQFVYAPGKQGYHNRKQLYDALYADGAVSSKSYEEFAQRLGLHAVNPKPQQQKPVQLVKKQTMKQRAQEVAAQYQNGKQTKPPVDYLHRPHSQMGRARRNAPGKASPFVQSLYEIDNAQKGPDYSVDYTSPKATQQVYQHNQQVRRQAAKTASDHIANDEYRRQSQPMIDNGTVGVMKPMGEIEQEMSDSASRFVDANLGDYINKAVLGEQNAAGKRAVDAYNNSFAAGGGGGGGINDLLMRSLAYNEENDPDKMIENLANNARGGLEKLFQNPSFVAKVKNEADMLGVTPEAYVESMLPHLKDRLSAALEKSEYNKYLPKDAFENMANRFIDSNTIGKLVRGATMTRGQRIMQERASAATAAGENPYYKGSTVENVVADVAGMVSDPVFKGAAGAGGKVAGKLIGNSTKLSALMANGNLAQRLMAKGAQVVTSGGVTGFVFDSTGSVIQNYSTGEDTSLGNTLKVAAKGGTTGAVNFATMSLAGIPLSEVGRSIGLKAVKGGSFWGNTGRATAKIGLESGKTYMEAMGMYLGGYVSGKLEGRTDANGKPIEFDLWNGTMESLPTAIGFRLQHAVEGLRGGRKNEKGEDMGWFGSTIANFKDFLTSDKAKESRFLMTEDERNQIFSSGAMNGLMPDGENIVSYAKRTKNKKVSYDDPYLETDASMIKNTYDQIMADPKVSWDAKAKFSAMVTGIMPSARPMMDYITFSSEDYVKDGLLRGKRKYVNEYSAKGELLSKIPYDNKVDRDNVVYKHNIVRENQRLYNAMGLLARQDRNNYELQNDFFVENMNKPGADVNILVTNMGDEGSHVFRDFSLFALNSEKGTVLKTIDSVAARNGMKSEDLIKAMKKNPMKRTDFEQNVCVELRRALESKSFPYGKVHVEQSNLNGKDVAEDNNLGTEQPNGDAVKQELNGLRQAEEEVEVLMRDNDVFSQNFKKLQSQGLTNPQIYDWMVQQGGLTVEQLEPFAHYINANARVQGMQEATKQKIENVASSFVQDWSYKDTLNGVGMVNADGSAETVLFVYHDGKELIVGSGDVSFNQPNEYGIRRAKEDVGDMLVCFDPQTGQMVYVHASEVDYSREMKPEELKAKKILELQNINSVPYNEAAQEQAMQDAAENQDQSESGKGNDASETPEIVSEATPVETPTDFSFNNGKGRINSYKATPHEKTKSDGTKEITFSSEVTFTKGAPKGHKEGEVINIGNGGGFIKIDPIDIDYQQYAVYGRLHDDGTAFSKDEATSEDIAEAKEMIDTLLTPQLAEEMGPQYNVKKIIIAPDGRVFAKFIGMDGNIPLKRNPLEKAPQDNTTKSEDSTTKEGDLTKDDTTLTKVDTTSGKDNTTNENLAPQEQPQPSRKFADGTEVPMATDSKGRPTPDYEKMTPEQSAEILTEDFGENAEKVVDGQIQKAEKALKDAEKMKVDYTAEPNDIMEQEALKKKTVEAAKKQLDHAQNIKKAMTAKKVAETVGKTEQTEGAHEAGSVAAQKFVNAPRLVGNKRTRMLADGETKIRGHYEIVPAESLTPSHDVNNDYKKSEGFPTDAEGRTVNDRDYEHDKAAQQNTDQIARKYNGMAIEQVPVVSDEGIVYDGNGRTMAGQKAAKEGTDGEYINDLLENAENFGFTREQIEQSGIEHPRLVLVTDERLPYDTATFSKFNRNEKKTQSNTEQAVAKAKTLTSDEVGAIVAEIEGNGSLDAFFNNSKAINDLVKTLVDKGIIGQNEVAQMMDSPERLSAQGREYVKNLLLGSIFKPETIRMLGIDSTVKNKAINAIRSVMDNMKLGEFSLRDEIDQAIQLLYEARQGGNKVDTLLRTPDMYVEDAAKRYPSISQMMALALEGKVADFRDLLDEYNRIAAARNTGEGNVFGESPTKPELIKEFLDFKKWQDYGTGHSENEGGNDVSGFEEHQQEASGGNKPAGSEPEPAVKVNKALKKIATEITMQTGIEVVTDEKEAQRALEDADSDVKYSREAGGAVLDWGNVPSKARISNDELTTIIMRNNREYIDELDKLGEGEFIEHYVDANGYFYTFRVDKNHHIYMDEAISKTSSANRERINELKEYYDGERARYSEEVRSNRSESQSELGRSEDSYRSTIGTGNSENSAMGGRIGESDSKGNVERDTSRPEQSGSALKEFRSANGEVYGFTVGGKIYLDTKKMKPETPLHEYTHLWTEALRNTNPEEWENVKGLFDKVDGLKDEVRKLYPELKGDALYEEMIATFSGREGAKKLEETVRNLAQQEGKSVEESAKATGFLGKVKEALQRYWKGVADMLHIHFTSAEEVADKVLADWASGFNPKDKEREGELPRAEEEDKPNSAGFTPKEIRDHQEKLDRAKEKYAKALKEAKSEKEIKAAEDEFEFTYKDHQNMNGVLDEASVADMWKKELESAKDSVKKDSKKLSADPMEALENAADAFHEEQKQKNEFKRNLEIGKARQEYEEAKKKGNANEISHAAGKLRNLLNEKYKAQGMGFEQRRKKIAEEIGKAEAEIIDKPWEQMDLEEREAVSSKNPLTESEINELNSEENKELIPAALAYLRGDKSNIINAISYFKIWNDVRNRHENVSDNSGTENGTQLDAADTTGGEGLGLGRGRESGRPDGPVDRGTGNETAPGERNGGESNQNDTTLSAGEQGNKQGEGNSSGMGAVPAGSSDTNGGGSAGGNGHVSGGSGRESSKRPADTNAGRKPTAKQGTTFPDSTAERLKQERADYEKKKKDFWDRWKKAGQGYAKIALTPFKKLNLTPEQIEMLPELFKMHLNGAVLKIKEGIYKFNEWKAAMLAEEGEELKMIGLSDDDIDRFIEDYWNTPYEMDGETHTIREWSSIYGNQQLKKKLKEPLEEKYKRQMEAEPIEVKVGDMKNIEETLPYLLPQQQEDVLKAETQFFGKEHTDREHAYGKGYLFTNGTGTGKTYTGLGIAKRLAKQGKGRILFITPSQKKVSDWIKDGKNLGLDIKDLDSWAKMRGTTATTESGEGMVITTFANFGLNKKLLETEWDAVIYDECHRIMENKKGTETARSMQHYMVTNRDENHCFRRLQSINPEYQKMNGAAEKFDALRLKEIDRIKKEYKNSHPSATNRDVDNATLKSLPRDLNSFAPADGMTFPKLGKAYQDFIKARDAYNKVEPKLKEQAKDSWKNTKTIFLSATPFNTRENLDYVEGYIFKYPETDERGMGGRTQFYLNHFGAAYKFRYHRLEQSISNPDAVAKQEVAFSDYLQNTLGTMSGRIIDSPYDYSRDFPIVAPDHAEDFNNAVQDTLKTKYLHDAYSKTIGDYNYGSALFETMKVSAAIDRIKQHLDLGRKVVIFHRRVESKEPLEAPFAYMLRVANEQIKMMKPGKERDEYIKECTEFRNKYADLLEWEKTLDYSMPREQIAKVFGEKNVLFFSGKESKKVKDKAIDTFNDDDSGKNIIVIQEASGKEGISLHDTTSKHQRVCITLALPQSPITALQIEGRIYRIGNMSNAIFEYPILGLNSEMMLFGEKFNNQVSTTENLALGSQARNLRDSFAKGILEHSGIVPVENQGVGGKEFDAATPSENDPFDNAVLDYYSNQKLNKNNREGSDYFPTPEPLGYKMVEWAGLGEGDSVLEPSAGHGAIARYVPKTNEMVSIEPSQSLFTKLQLRAGGLGRKFMNNTFENYALNNKHDVIVMNPPFGKAGALAIQHVDKAFKHLDEGGRIVAIIPRGSTDKKFDKWYNEQKNVAMRAEVNLPDILFQQAGTRVACRVVVLDKISDAALRSKAGYPEKIDLSGHYDKIEDFFNDIRDIEMPDRIIDTNLKMQKKAKAAVKDIMEINGVKNVSYGKTGINVSLTGSWMNYGISFTGSDKPNYWRDKMANYYTKYDELQKLEYQENKQAVFDELKKLSCKLAGMTEDEMQRYICNRQENGKTHFRIEENAENEGSSEKLFLSLQEKYNNKKEYNETVTELANRVKQGTARIAGEIEEGSRRGSSPNYGGLPAIAGKILNGAYKQGRGQSGEMAGGASDRKGEEVLSSDFVYAQIEDWAKENKCYFTEEDIAKGSLDGEAWKNGAEAYVYRSKDGKSAIKVMPFDPYYKNPVDYYLDRNRYFNDVFPDTAIEVMGYGRDNKGKFSIFYKQPLIEGETVIEHFNGDGEKANEYIDNMLANMGYNKKVPHDEWGCMSDSNGKYNIFDVNYSNVIIGKDGKPHVIDAEVLPVDYKNDGKTEIKDNDSETHFRNDNDSPVSISKDAPAVVKHVAKVAKATGGKVKMLQSVEEVTNADAKARLEKGEKVEGWYDERTGEVVLYMPNVHDSYTAEKTVWHEIVGHKGMRELFGNDNYDKFLDDIYFNLDKPEYADLKKLVMKELQYNPFDYRNAIEEAIARMAEEGHGEHGLWNNLKNKVANIFREIGYRVAPNTKDIKYLLWLAKNYSKHPESDGYFAIRRNALLHKLERDNTPSIVERNGMFFDNDGKDHDYLLDLNHKDFEEATDGKVHFRTSPMTASKIEEYNRRLGTKLYAFKESTVDHMQSLQEAMEIISGEKNAWTDIPSAFNPLQAQNRIDSIVQQKAEEYDRKYTKPLDDSFKKVVSTMSGSDKDEQLRNAQLYMITKHGLERNRVFFVRDAIRDIMNDDVTKAKTLMKDWNDKQKDLADELEKGNIRFDEYLEQMDEWIRSNVDINFVADEHDYSGFHGMQNIAKTSDPYDDKLAIDNVMSAESQMGSDLAKDFWTKKKAATDYVIDQEYYNGFIDNSDRDYLKGMFQWYVPLRKFDDTTAEDVYGYIGEKGDPSNFVGPVLANAKGRSSLSDINVMAQISAMAKSSLINGGKNVVKQHFARFVSAYETGNTKDKIFVEVNPWLEKHVVDGNEVWEEVTPQIPENATQQQISNILQNFEDTMQAKKATGDAKLASRKPNIGFKFQRAKNKSEHIVDVYIAGKKRSFVCQGNPRAAQALNGLVKDSGTRNVATRFDAKITRKIAQFNTSLNPDFMMSNMLRDLTFASANVTKEGFAYTKDFLKEYAGNIISIKNGKGSGNYLTMFRKYRDGKLDINNERERMFKEFMDNGGQTGFVQIKKLESLIDEYDNLIKKGSKDADGWFVKKIKEGGTFIETANEIIENVARYSTYCTSRKHGRSVGRSIYDAKEVSTNFNRHGSGDAIRKLKTSKDSNIDKIFRRSLGFFNSWMKNHTQFYNAGVQGANLFFKNYKSAWKTTAVSFGMLPLGLGIAQALINQFLINNEDEKDRKGVKDPYAELPEWKRRNNICIYTGHGNFKTIPIAIELRAFFGLGDIAAGYVVNDKLKSSTPIGYDILGQMAQLVPASDFLGHHSPSNNIKELGEDAILAVTPTTISPAMELAFNRDWTGRPFYRDYDYLDKAPRWKRAYDNTNGIYMSINKWANQGTNSIDSSNADMKGNETLDYLTAPYAWQHLIDSYTGGMGSTIGRTYKTLEAVGKGVVSGAKNKEGFSKGFSDEFEKFDKNQIPLYRVFNYTPKEGQDMQRTRSKWYNYSDELKQTEYNIKQLKTNTPDVLKNMENNAKKFNFTHGKEGKAYNIWEAADSYISKKKRQLNKASNPEVIKSINEDINRKMQEAVNDLDKLN